MRRRPDWWDWELRFSLHIAERMLDRSFTELDIRVMLENATWVSRDIAPGRWLARTRHQGRRWGVILEPDVELQVVMVVTAYPIGQ